VFEGRVFRVRVDELCLADGSCVERETVIHPGAVVVGALDRESRVVFVKQYRHAVRRSLLELPAGTLEPGEDPLPAAQRELREEAGLIAGRWEPLGSFFSSPGFLREELHAFLARELTEVAQELEGDEDISLEWVSLASLLAGEKELEDAKTLAALWLIQRRLQEESRS
jgi:ADP-ribose pyrophosphatase